MRVTVGSNARARASRRVAAAALSLFPALSLGCGGDASDGAEGGVAESTMPALEPALSADRDESTQAAADADDVVDASGEVTEDGTPLVQPRSAPFTDPVEPTPPPTGELESTRPLLPPSAPDEVEVGQCRFEYLGEWVRCESAGWPNVIATDAPDLRTCMQRCLEREDCTAVTDYLWLGQPELGCFLYTSSCDEPAYASDWGEEDGGREFRRVCDDDAQGEDGERD